jgi:hypothetical protein
MSNPVRAGVVAVAAAAIGLALSGCGSDSGSESSSSAESTSSSAASSSEPTSTSEAAPTTSAPAAGADYTIAQYIKDNNISETPVHRGDPGSPTIDLPVPQGWQDAGQQTPAWAWGAILYTDPATAANPPSIIAIMSKLTGNVDPAKILEYAPNEVKNLPGYENLGDGNKSSLGGFDAYQIGGAYTKDGVKRVIAQKTVVIPGQDALYVLQLNADGTEDQLQPLMAATSAIDEGTTITP